MKRLINGVRRFQKNIYATKRHLFSRLANAQHPHTMFITCSDSRICPNLITQSEPGEIFVMRNAGNLVPPAGSGSSSEAATIEFAIRVLKVEDIVVCGHTDCGAMKHLLNPRGSQFDYINDWLKNANRSLQLVESYKPKRSGAELLMATIEVNVIAQTENLLTYPVVAEALEAGRVRVHSWVYNLESGDISAFDPKSKNFAPVAAAEVVPHVAGESGSTALREWFLPTQKGAAYAKG